MANDVVTGTFCNNDCIFCYAKHYTKEDAIYKNIYKEKTTPEIKHIINSFKNQGISSIQVNGGESTLRGDFLKIIKYANNLNLDVTLLTNGTKFADKNFIKKIHKIKISEIVVSLYGSNEKVHDNIVKKKSFKKTIRGIINIKNYYATRLCVCSVICKQNYKDLWKIYDKLVKIGGINTWFVQLVRPFGRAEINYKKFSISYLKFKGLLEKNKIKNSSKINICFVDFPLCVFPSYFLGRNDVHFESLEGPFLNVSKRYKGGSTAPLYQWSKFKLKSNLCNQCQLSNKCTGVFKEYYKIYENSELKKLRKVN